MSKKYVPLEVLEAWINENCKLLDEHKSSDLGDVTISCHRVSVPDLLSEVYKSAITFDDDGWCWDVSKAPLGQDVLFLLEDGNLLIAAVTIVNKVVCDDHGYTYNLRSFKAFQLLPSIPERKLRTKRF